jgi:hypothetical protein
MDDSRPTSGLTPLELSPRTKLLYTHVISSGSFVFVNFFELICVVFTDTSPVASDLPANAWAELRKPRQRTIIVTVCSPVMVREKFSWKICLLMTRHVHCSFSYCNVRFSAFRILAEDLDSMMKYAQKYNFWLGNSIGEGPMGCDKATTVTKVTQFMKVDFDEQKVPLFSLQFYSLFGVFHVAIASDCPTVR